MPNALDFKLTCKEIEVRNTCDRLDYFLHSKQVDAQNKATKIHKLEALAQRKLLLFLSRVINLIFFTII